MLELPSWRRSWRGDRPGKERASMPGSRLAVKSAWPHAASPRAP